MAARAVAPSVVREARRAVAELKSQARPHGAFDPSRYFRPTETLGFLNVRTPIVRALGRSIARAHRDDWTVRDAQAFADRLIVDPHLEIKGVAIETLACFHRQFTAPLLPAWKRWLATGRSANWATTDTICGALITPLLMADRSLVPEVASWVRHRVLWVRRAAAVSLVRLAARGLELDVAYDVADALLGDEEDLIHKATGWLLREAGRTDPARLTTYLRARGAVVPRTTLRYAIERFPTPVRLDLLRTTRSAAGAAAAGAPSGAGSSGRRASRQFVRSPRRQIQ